MTVPRVAPTLQKAAYGTQPPLPFPLPPAPAPAYGPPDLEPGVTGHGALTAKEQALFDLLSGHRGRLFTRAEIVERVWGMAFDGDDRIVDVYVKRIRHKLREDVIETVRGAGYRRPEKTGQRQALPHFAHLSPDARTLLDLGRRVLGAGSPRAVLREAHTVLARPLRVGAVALLTEAGTPGAGWSVQDACGDDRLDWGALPALEAATPLYLGAGRDSREVALLPLVGPGPEPWGALAVAAELGAGWEAGARAQLEAVAALVNPALRLGVETELRVRAQREAEDLHAELEGRVRRRTEALAREGADQAALNDLSRRLERAGGVAEGLAAGLPGLARLAGTTTCAAWLGDLPGAVACFRADGTPGTPPGLGGSRPPPSSLHLDAGGQTLALHAFDEAGLPPGSGEASALLPTAAQSVALTLSRLLYLEALEATALTDEDTGLGNRPAFLADLGTEVAYSARHGAGFGLGLVEIGNIRSLNATVGYAGGNDLILRLAATLRDACRAEDRVYRLGGATFAVLLRFAPQGGRVRALEGWRERLRPVLGGLARHVPFPLELCSSQVSCPEDARTTSELLRLALDRLSPGLPGALPDRRTHLDARG